MTPKPGNRTQTLAFFGALSLFFSTIEYLFPKPVPFFRLGLSNLPLLLALDFMDFRNLVLLTILKILGQALLNGTLASYVFLFSLAGSLASLLAMVATHRLFGKQVTLIGVSLYGALASNLVQVFLSIQFIFGTSAWVIAPLFLGLGTVSGVAVGFFAQHFASNSRWLRKVRHGWTD